MTHNFPNTLISASAGSGKTEALARRYIALLDLEVPPGRILALTFSRKAAAEFLERILGLLASTVTDSRPLDLQPYRPPLRPERALELLRRIIGSFHQLQLSTLDSFFAFILRAWPYEFGIEGDLNVLDEASTEETLETVLSIALNSLPPEEQQSFASTLDQAALTTTQPSPLKILRDLFAHARQIWLSDPVLERWGSSSTIWSTLPPWCHAPTFSKASEKFLKLLADEIPAKDRDLLPKATELLEDLSKVALGQTAPSGAQTVLENLRKFVDRTKDHFLLARRKIPLSSKARHAADELCQALLRARLEDHLESTRSIGSLLRSFEAVWSRSAPHNGLLNFADLNRALLGEFLPPSQTAPLDGSVLGYRLDGWFDHWLLDEFQDTSRLQWRALEPLLGEILQDPGGGRSAFFVGDTKQAIYGWRGGDPTLFEHIGSYYSSNLQSQTLDHSWRSGPDLLKLVNHLFGQSSPLEKAFHPASVDRWREQWRDHQSNRPNLSSWAGVFQLTAEAKKEDSEDQKLQAVVAAVASIRQAHPEASIGILYRSNADVVEATSALRAAGFQATREAAVHLAEDNPAGKALLAALRFLHDPRDTLSRGHLHILNHHHPFQIKKQPVDFFDPASVSIFLRHSLHRIAQNGLVRWAEAFLAHCFPPDLRQAFLSSRIEDLLRTLQLVDIEAPRLPSTAVRHLEHATLSDPPGARSIQVMTYHKSKGLSFDATIVPLFARPNNSLYAQHRLHVEKDPHTGRARWILRAPNQLVCDLDPTLSDARSRHAANLAYEELCCLYVSLTRSRQILTLLLPPKPLGSSALSVINAARTHPSHLSPSDKECPSLDGVSGSWLLATGSWPPVPPPSKPSSAPASPSSFAILPGSGQSALQPEAATRKSFPTPAFSRSTDLRIRASQKPGDSKSHGEEIHRQLASIEWIDQPLLEPSPIEPTADALTLLKASQELLEVFSPPADRSQTILWREKSFDVLFEGRWLSGTFDRVHIQKTSDGRFFSASIFDFKTSNAGSGTLGEGKRKGVSDSLRAKYADQINHYRDALSVLLGISREQITASLVYLDEGKIEPVPPPQPGP